MNWPSHELALTQTGPLSYLLKLLLEVPDFLHKPFIAKIKSGVQVRFSGLNTQVIT